MDGGKQNVVFLYSRLFPIKGLGPGSCWDMDEPQKCYAKCKKPDTEVTPYTIPFTWDTRNKQVHGDKTQDRWLPGAGRRETGSNSLAGTIESPSR